MHTAVRQSASRRYIPPSSDWSQLLERFEKYKHDVTRPVEDSVVTSEVDRDLTMLLSCGYRWYSAECPVRAASSWPENSVTPHDSHCKENCH